MTTNSSPSPLQAWKFSLLSIEINRERLATRRELTLTVKERRSLGGGKAWTDASANLDRQIILMLYDGNHQLEEVNLDLFVHGLADGQIPSYHMICHPHDCRIQLSFWRIKKESKDEAPSVITCGPSPPSPLGFEEPHGRQFRTYDITFNSNSDYDSATQVFTEKAKLVCQQNTDERDRNSRADSAALESSTTEKGSAASASPSISPFAIPQRPLTQSPSLLIPRRHSPLVSISPVSGTHRRITTSPRPFGPRTFQPHGGVAPLDVRRHSGTGHMYQTSRRLLVRQVAPNIEMSDSDRRTAAIPTRSLSATSARPKMNNSPLPPTLQKSPAVQLPEHQRSWKSTENGASNSTDMLKNVSTTDAIPQQPLRRELPFLFNQPPEVQEIPSVRHLPSSVASGVSLISARHLTMEERDRGRMRRQKTESVEQSRPRRIWRGSNPESIGSLTQTPLNSSVLPVNSLSMDSNKNEKAYHEFVRDKGDENSQSSGEMRVRDGGSYKDLGNALLGTCTRYGSDVDAPGETDDESLAHMQATAATEQCTAGPHPQSLQNSGPQIVSHPGKVTADVGVQVDLGTRLHLSHMMKVFRAARKLQAHLIRSDAAVDNFTLDQDTRASVKAQCDLEFETMMKAECAALAADFRLNIAGFK